MFAIVGVSGKQFKVTTGDVILVSALSGKAGDTVVLDHVLLTNDGKETKIGSPEIPKMIVKAKIISQEKGKKVDIRRFKSKVRHRKHVGFRPQLTRLEIISIGHA